LRLKGHDYAAGGVYFITILVKDRKPVLGEVVEGHLHLSALGDIVEHVWLALPAHYPHVLLDVYCVMPDHFHGILIINQKRDSTPAQRQHGLSEVVRNFKTFSAMFINTYQGTTGTPFWQRGFYDHVIRNHPEHMRMAAYICSNPRHWVAKERIAG
jgi:REP-associated tyrosine transposase